MTEMKIPAHEAGIVRLFAIDLDESEIEAFNTRSNDSDGANDSYPIKEALGATAIDDDFFEIIRLKDLEDYGLDQYLITGAGLPKSEVAAHSVALNALKGHVLLVMSAAFEGYEQELSIKPPLRHVLTLHEDRPQVKFEPLPSESAKGNFETKPGKAKSDARMSGMVATVALLVMFALVGLMIWIAG